MINIYKANMRKLFKSKLYLIGLIIAVVVTHQFTGNLMGFGGVFNEMTPAGRMHFVSAAIVGFFTIYTPLFVCEEYSEGSIKNKFISGFTQKEMFGGGMMTQLSAAFIMWVLHILAGVVAGARPSGAWWVDIITDFIAMLGYVAVVYALSFRITKIVASAIISFVVMNVAFNTITFGNMFLMITKGVLYKIVTIAYNVSCLGQWFVHTGLMGDEANPGAPVQIILSVCIIVSSNILGMTKLDKRDLK